jgi:hypothetical protein
VRLLQNDLGELRGIRLFSLVAMPLVVLYLATATWTLPYHIDAATNVFTAWEMGENGRVTLNNYEELATDDYFGNIGWIVPAQSTAAAVYPPGTASLAAPLYAIWPAEAEMQKVYGTNTDAPSVEIPIPPLGPAAITAAVVAAIAVGLLALVFREFVDGRLAVLSAYLVGLGTAMWPIAADALWQHGPAVMWITAGMLLSIRHQVASGFAFGAAILTRPHTALIAAGNGLWQSWKTRSIRPAGLVGFGSVVGLGVLVWFNDYVFGSPSITGGYGDRFAARMANLDLLEYAGNIILVFVHPMRGVLIYSPFLILLLPGLRSAWRAAPAWVRGSAVGGVLYLLLQLKAEGYSGGSGFWGYRYPLEALAAAAPLLLLSYREWVTKQPALIQRAFLWLVAASLMLTTIGVVLA